MLLGMAHQIRDELGVPVLCSLPGEDIFLHDPSQGPFPPPPPPFAPPSPPPPPLSTPACLLPTTVTQGTWSAPPSPLPSGIKVDGFAAGEPPVRPPFRVGYLARICPEKGLHLLCDAFHKLVQRAGDEEVRLGIAGYLGPRDEAYFEQCREQLREWGIDDRVDYVGEVDRTEKAEFLRSLHVLSVPTVYREPKGVFVLEALASGTPVVLPDHGAFPELVARTGGGRLVEPGNTEALAAELHRLMSADDERNELARAGEAAVRRDYNDAASAERLLRVYRHVTR